MNTVFRTPFEVRVGDRISREQCGKEPVAVTETNTMPRTFGGILGYRNGERPEPEAGDHYQIMFDTGSGISGRWDGEMGFRVIAD